MLNEEQKEKLKKAGYDDNQIRAYESKKFGNVIQPSETGQDITQVGSELKSEFRDTIKSVGDIRGALERGEQGDLRSIFQTTGELAGGISNAIGSVIKGGVKAILPQKQEEQLKSGVIGGIKGLTKVGEVITPDALMEQNVKMIEAYENASPALKRDINSVLGLGSLGLDIVGASATGKVAQQSTRQLNRLRRSGIETIKKNTPRLIRKTTSELPAKQVDDMADTLTTAYRKSFVDDSPAIVNKLEKLAFKNDTTVDDMLKMIAKEGYVPEVDGKLGKFTNSIQDVNTRLERLSVKMDPVYEQVPTLTPINNLFDSAKNFLKQAPDIGTEFNKVVRQLDSIEKSLRSKYGEVLTAKQLNQTLRQLNKSTKAFTREVFEQDADNIVAQAVRKQINDITPQSVGTSVNREMGRLLQMRDVLRALNNKTIDVGVIGGQLGRYLGTVLGAGAGITVAGPGGLVVAGILAYMGGNFVAQLLRKFRFNPKKFKALIDSIKQDDKLVEQLIKQADGENKEILKRALLPEGAIRLTTPARESGVQVVPAGKGVPGRDGGKFKKTFSSTEENLNQKKNLIDKGKDFLKKMNDDQGGFVKNPLAQSNKVDIVNKQPIKVFRGEGKGVGNSTFVQGEYFADSKKFASTFGDVSESTIPANSKIFNFDAVKNTDKLPKELLVDQPTLTKYLTDKGYDFTRNTNARGVEYVKLNKEYNELIDLALGSKTRIEFIEKTLDNYRKYGKELERIKNSGSYRGKVEGSPAVNKVWEDAQKIDKKLLQKANK